MQTKRKMRAINIFIEEAFYELKEPKCKGKKRLFKTKNAHNKKNNVLNERKSSLILQVLLSSLVCMQDADHFKCVMFYVFQIIF